MNKLTPIRDEKIIYPGIFWAEKAPLCARPRGTNTLQHERVGVSRIVTFLAQTGVNLVLSQHE